MKQSMKLSWAAIMAAGCVIAVPAADAAVVTFDNSAETLVWHPNGFSFQEQYFDITQPPTQGHAPTPHSFSYPMVFICCSGTGAPLSIEGNVNAAIAQGSTPVQVADSFGVFTLLPAATFDPGESIGPVGPWQSSAVYSWICFCPTSATLVPPNSYLGVRVQLADGPHFGWVHLGSGGLEHPVAWAYETTPNTPIVVPSPCDATGSAGDINDDGVVNTLDLGMLLSSWSIPATAAGCAGSQPCCSDLNGDGVVNTLDLGIVLSSWTLRK